MNRDSAALSSPVRGARWALLVVVLAAAALRLLEAVRTPLWFDEIYMLQVGRLAPRDLLALVARDIHPPLAFLLYGAWQALVGDHPVLLKLLPILLSLGTIVLTARLGRRIGSPAAGLFAAALVTLNVTHVQVSQDFEVYALLALFAAALANLAWDALAPRDAKPGTTPGGAAWTTWALLAATGVLAIYTHYLELYVVGTVVLAGLALAPARERPRWLALAVLLALAFAPQAPVYLAQFRREGSGSFFTWIRPDELAEVMRHTAFGEAFAVPLVFGLALVPLARTATRRAALLVWALILVPLVAKRLLPLVPQRDFVAMIPLVMALAATGAAMLPWRGVARAAAWSLVAFAAYAWHAHRPFPEPHDLERAARFISAHARAGDVIVNAETHGQLFFEDRIAEHGPAAPVRLLVDARRSVPFFEGGLVVPDSERLDSLQFAALARQRRWWGVQVDRAYVTRGVVSRAGRAGAQRFQSLARSGPWRFGVVTVWSGTPGIVGPGGAPTRPGEVWSGAARGGSAPGSRSGRPPAGGRPLHARPSG
jgi:mannosyltransferase